MEGGEGGGGRTLTQDPKTQVAPLPFTKKILTIIRARFRFCDLAWEGLAAWGLASVSRVGAVVILHRSKVCAPIPAQDLGRGTERHSKVLGKVTERNFWGFD